MISRLGRPIALAGLLLAGIAGAAAASALPLAGAGIAKDTAPVTKAYYRGGHYGGYRGWGGYGFYRPYYRPYYG
ncbi:MAG: hypothetical protein JSS20_17275, partial [Proteobacteria bacterium]|nr:hypothetical protein [Pseudomonadota bacterium]